MDEAALRAFLREHLGISVRVAHDEREGSHRKVEVKLLLDEEPIASDWLYIADLADPGA